jgi:hypothetical protein
MNFARRSAGPVSVQVRAPQTFTIMLLSVAERFLSKPFEHLLHPAQKLSLGKMVIKIPNKLTAPPQILVMYNGTISEGFLKEKLI